MSEEEIRKWMSEHYPEYADNLELGRVLFEKERRKKSKGVAESGGSGDVKPLEEVAVGVRGVFRGVVGEINTMEYEGCAICKKKICDDPMHMGQRRRWVVTSLRLYDKTASRWAGFIGEEKLKVDEGDEVQVKGYGRKYRDEAELMIDEVKILMRRGVRMVVSEVAKAGSVSKGILQVLCEDNGVSIDDVMPYLEKKEIALVAHKEPEEMFFVKEAKKGG